MTQRPPDKSRLRQALLAQRQTLVPAVRAEWDRAIGKHLSRLLETRPSRTIGIYWPIRNEPDLRELYADWSARGMQLALPVVIDPDLPLKFLAWAPGDPLVKDAMGVWVPAAAEGEVRPDIVLVPCVGFNDARVRLGYGGGFYDRTLANAPRPLSIGIGYSFMQADFAAEVHDVALDMIITETATPD